MVMVPSPLPPEGFTDSQAASAATVQLVFELMVKLVLPASDTTSRLNGVTARRLIPLCETVTGWEPTPAPDTVSVPILADAIVLDEYEAVIVPFPVPLEGLTLNQFESTAIVQLVFELIVKVVLPAPDPTSRSNGVIARRLIPLCETVTGWEPTPLPDIVSVPILADAIVFAV